ncbi:MAG: ribonuclease III [Kiritimatiellae bacterium]|nr:ribonuclease III [Kiritimatiellia bacterium]
MEILGYEFRDGRLLQEALTTPACRMDAPDSRDNQRLEFLGDAVLGLLSAERVYGEFPGEKEGSLTVRRTHMVSSAALCEAAGRLGLVSRLRRNRHAEELSPNAKTLADAVEAVLGAVYLDGGLDAARRVFAALGLTANAALPEWSANPKGELQVRTQAMKPPRHPEYELLRTEGAAHEPRFTVRVTVDGVGSAEATAGSRKEAEAQAASRLLMSSRLGASGASDCRGEPHLV